VTLGPGPRDAPVGRPSPGDQAWHLRRLARPQGLGGRRQAG
jgi:hypothetical protein